MLDHPAIFGASRDEYQRAADRARTRELDRGLVGPGFWAAAAGDEALVDRFAVAVGAELTSTVPSNADAVPTIVSGLLTTSPCAGCSTVMFWPAAPSTHHVSSGVSWRTNTTVVGPTVPAVTSTSPDRLSPAWNSPTTGSVKPR